MQGKNVNPKPFSLETLWHYRSHLSKKEIKWRPTFLHVTATN